VKFCLNLAVGGPYATPDGMVELAKAAEQAGWDGVFLEDYLAYYLEPGMPTIDPWMTLATMAMTTERILLGTAVTPLARRPPWKVARELLTLDHCSEGRAVLGVGLGDVHDPSWIAVGDPTDLLIRAQMVDEALEIIDGLSRGQQVAFDGRHYRITSLSLRPLPIHRPRPAIWVGGLFGKAGVLRRAAKYDGALIGWKSATGRWEDSTLIAANDLQSLRAQVEEIRGTAPFEYVVGGARPNADRDAELRYVSSMAEAGATWWMLWIPPCSPEEARSIARDRLPRI
jgi:alkanesulfonate monooxygenase SsuD/methylene tetrahydromethanopterin reductase-like flavin-dependent oxidoreductase (luciferase family)